MSKCCWTNSANRFPQWKVVTNFQFVKNALFTMYNKVKHNKMRYVCIGLENRLDCNSNAQEQTKRPKNGK